MSHAPSASARVNPTVTSSREPVALVGIGCRFGGTTTPAEFWRLLCAGTDAVREIPSERFRQLGVEQDPQPGTPGKVVTRQGSFLDRIDLFDAHFFGISPREAACMDPQHRLLLEVAWEAVEDAGMLPEQLTQARTGTYVGLWSGDYEQYLFQATRNQDLYMAIGGGRASAAGRVSFGLNLQGPSLAVDTGCSSSLVAVHLACQAIRAGDCDMALAGGVNLILHPGVTLAYSYAGMLAPDGRCKFGDARANGYVRSEGGGLVLLKKLSRAIADHDRIYAVIVGDAVNNDGHQGLFVTPSEAGQEALLRRAYAQAGIDPGAISYVEAHGTGTAVGDPIETRTLGRVLSSQRTPDRPLIIGSVKTNIGHTEAAAGIAGLIKASLCLHHGIVPPNLHFQTPNPNIPWEEIRLQVPRELTPLPEGNGATLAAVNSFGITGTNAHAILQQYRNEGANTVPADDDAGPWVLPLSARSADALRELQARWIDWLAAPVATPSRLESPFELREFCGTAALRRMHHEHRLAIVGRTREELAERLRSIGDLTPASPAGAPKLAFVYSGQGPQWWGMGRELLQTSPAFRAELERVDECVRAATGWSILEELSRDEATSRLDQTAIAQPAIFAVQMALTALWRSWGIEPAAVVGHSVGEVAAACAAGVLSLEDGVRVICHRGRLMQEAPAGRMIAAEMSVHDAEAAIAGSAGSISLAADNAPSSVTLSGDESAMDALVKQLEAKGVVCRPLKVNYAFHSAHMEPFTDPMQAAVHDLRREPGRIPIASTVTGTLATDAEFTAGYWPQNIRRPVLFRPAVQALIAAGCTTWVEIAPHPVLATSILQTLEMGGKNGTVLASLRRNRPERATLLEALAALYSQGCDIAWPGVFPATGRVAALPAYPWQRKWFWFDAPEGANRSGGPAPDQRASGSGPWHLRPVRSPALSGFVYETSLRASCAGCVEDHRIFDTVIVPAPVLLELACDAATQAWRIRPAVIEDFIVHRALVLSDDVDQTVQVVLGNPEGNATSFEIHAANKIAAGESAWILQASGRILTPPPAGSGEEPGMQAVGARGPCDEHVHTADEFYAAFASRGATLGPAARSIRELRRGSGGASATLHIPETANEFGSDRPHPVLLDAALQVLALSATWPAENTHAAQALTIFCGCKRVRLMSPGASENLACRVAADSESSSGAFCGNIQLLAGNRVIGEIEEARFQSVTRSQVLAGQIQSAAELVWDVTWIPRNPPARVLHRSPPDYLVPPAQARLELTDALRKILPVDGTEQEATEAFSTLALHYVVQAFRQLGWNPVVGSRIALPDLLRELHLLEQHRRLTGRMLEMLAEEKLLSRDGADWVVTREWPAGEATSRARAMLQSLPGYATELRIFERCGSRLADVLAGRCDPLQLLFPEGSLESAGQLYENSSMARGPNALMLDFVARTVAALPPGRVLRVLEIGAGTGGTTGHLLPVLRSVPCEYVFTDVSNLFLQRAQEKNHAYPFVHYALLDIERNPTGQGFTPGQFDLIVAANVLHATRDLQATLGNVLELMNPGGMLALIEGFRPARWIDLVFGQLEGWWRFTDVGLRPAHPLLSLEKWDAVLQAAGFASVAPIPAQIPGHPSLFEQALILAQAPRGAQTTTSAAGGAVANVFERGPWLLFADESPLSAAVVEQLAGGTDPALQIVRSDHYRVVDRHTIAVDASRPGDIARALDALLAASTRPVSQALYLWGNNPGVREPIPVAAYEYAVRLAAGLLHAIQGVLRASAAPRPKLWIATHGAQSAGATTPDERAAALWGIGRVLAVEHPEIYGGLVDLGHELSVVENARALLHHVAHADQEDQCALRHGDRFVPRLASPAAPEETAINWAGDGCFIITGGTGGVGLHVAQGLAAQGARQIVLIARTPLPPRTEWNSLSGDDRAAPIVAQVRELEKRGTSVLTVAADIADAGALAHVRTILSENHFGPVRGIFHAAAAIQDGLLAHAAAASLDVAFRAKALGALHLEAGFADQPLEFFVCFSSIGSLLGLAGQSNYAAANAFLDAVVERRRKNRQPALGINWGVWHGAGLALTGGGKSTLLSLEQHGLLGFSPAEGVAALDLLLRRRASRAVVVRVDSSAFPPAHSPGEEPRLLAQLRLDKPAVGGNTPGPKSTRGKERGQVREQLLALEPGAARQEFLQHHVTQLLANVLRLEISAIDPAKTLGSHGLDSLMGVEFKNRCEQSLGVKLSATMVWNYPTIVALVPHLAEKLGATGPAAAVPPRPPAIPPARDSATATPDMTTSGIAELSEEEALQALLQKAPR